jgi:hypothetical protein
MAVSPRQRAGPRRDVLKWSPLTPGQPRFGRRCNPEAIDALVSGSGALQRQIDALGRRDRELASGIAGRRPAAANIATAKSRAASATAISGLERLWLAAQCDQSRRTRTGSTVIDGGVGAAPLPGPLQSRPVSTSAGDQAAACASAPSRRCRGGGDMCATASCALAASPPRNPVTRLHRPNLRSLSLTDRPLRRCRQLLPTLSFRPPTSSSF